MRGQRHPNSTVLLVLPNRADLERARIENDAVVLGPHRGNVVEHIAKVGLARVAKAEQVQISRRTMRLPCPHGEERRALQYEPACMRRRGQSVQQPLVDVSQQHQLKVIATLLGELEQLGSNRGAHVLQRLRHVRASR